MNPTILNRDFTHPTDGWYQIEAKGNHPNRAAGVVQVIDEDACNSIVRTFNAQAQAGRLRHGNEMLIDHEHFKDQADKETRAYGWLTKLENRADGIYGQIRWTKTGKEAVDGGDYRFFSTEYAPDDLKVVNRGEPVQVRPLRLDGLSLTNMNNNLGQKPITNRNDFPGATAPGDSNQPNNQGKKMKSVCTLLGLSPDAAEEAVHAEVSKLKNRIVVLEPLEADNTSIKNRLSAMEGEQCDSLMTEHGIKDDAKATREKLRPVLLNLKNREERQAFLKDCVPVEKVTETTQQRQLRNRETKQPEKDSTSAGLDEKQLAQKAEAEVQDYKIRNRCTYGEARNAVRSAKPELFGLK